MNTPTGTGPATLAIAYSAVPVDPGWSGIVTEAPPTIGAPLSVLTGLAVPTYTNVVFAAATEIVTEPTPGGTAHNGPEALVTLPGTAMIAISSSRGRP